MNKWFSFQDNHSGGYKKTPLERYFIEAPDQSTAEDIFERETGQYPHAAACECCGANFTIFEVDAPLPPSKYDKTKIIPLTS